MYGDSKLREFLVSYTKYLDQQGMLVEGQVEQADTLVGDFIHTYPSAPAEIMTDLYGGLSSYTNVVDLEDAMRNPEEEQAVVEERLEPVPTNEDKVEELVTVEPPGAQTAENPPYSPEVEEDDTQTLVNESDVFQPELTNEEPELVPEEEIIRPEPEVDENLSEASTEEPGEDAVETELYPSQEQLEEDREEK